MQNTTIFPSSDVALARPTGPILAARPTKILSVARQSYGPEPLLGVSGDLVELPSQRRERGTSWWLVAVSTRGRRGGWWRTQREDDAVLMETARGEWIRREGDGSDDGECGGCRGRVIRWAAARDEAHGGGGEGRGCMNSSQGQRSR
ncbi:hypothetical protein Droror1_Dr00010829 [Drosera rotundifolia]